MHHRPAPPHVRITHQHHKHKEQKLHRQQRVRHALHEALELIDDGRELAHAVDAGVVEDHRRWMGRVSGVM